jgi:hypothetical protein
MRTGIASLLVLAAWLAPIGAAGTIYVHGSDGNDEWSGLCATWDGGTCGPKRTIQAGINVAVAGDEVILAPVTYTGTGNRDCDFLGRAITVRSLNPDDPVVVAWTVVDCEAAIDNWHRGFNFVSAEGRDSVLAGLTIKNGCAPLIYSPPPLGSWNHEGGAIAIKGSSPTIDRCVFINNQSYAGGGGAIISNGVTSPADAGAPCIVGCTFVGNAARAYGGIVGAGGAIDCDGGGVLIERCGFLGNTLQGASWSIVGGGALILWRCQGVILDCEFRGNHVLSGGFGGGLSLSWSTATFVNCVISGNDVAAGGAGGALFARDDVFGGGGGSDVTLINCVLTGNRARYGGAICAYRSSDVRLVNCLVAGNTATYGGAFATLTIPSPGSLLEAINCTITGNRAPLGPMLDWRVGSAAFANCIIWNGFDWYGSGVCDITYSIVEGGWYGTGNLADDPLFAVPGYWDDNGTPDYWDDDSWIEGDSRLLPGSPCIDAGSNDAVPAGVTTDLAGNPRFADDPATPDTGFGTPPLVDMGAYEFMPLGDVNCDGVVNFDDINAFVLALSDPVAYAAAFPSCDRLKADCNGDGLVNFDDINAFVAVLSGT